MIMRFKKTGAASFLGCSALLLSAAALFMQSSADAKPRPEQAEARKQMMDGNVRSLSSIKKRIIPKMAGAEYIGHEFDPESLVYFLKFVKNGRVMLVYVDARSGAILRQR